MTWRQLTSAGLTFVALVQSGFAQQPTPQRAPGTLTGGVTAVLVDVVVRDRKHQPVRDLTQADFEVLEDGVPQTIGSFAPVRDGVTRQAPTADVTPMPSAPAAGAPTVGTRAPGPDGPPVTALVFHGLSLEARRRAVLAAQGYVGDGEET